MSVIRFAVLSSRRRCDDNMHGEGGSSAPTGSCVACARCVQTRGTPRVDLLWMPVQEMKTASVVAASSGGVLQRSASVGGPRWILSDGVLCSNREMFYAEATVTAERME